MNTALFGNFIALAAERKGKVGEGGEVRAGVDMVITRQAVRGSGNANMTLDIRIDSQQNRG